MAISIQEQITKQEAIVAAAQEKLATLIKQASAAALFESVGPGYTVSFKVGRAETRREVTGTVRGRGLVKDVDSVRVEVGEGFDVEVWTVKVAELTGVTAPDDAKDKADLLRDAAEAGLTLQSDNPSAERSHLVPPLLVSEADALLNEVLG